MDITFCTLSDDLYFLGTVALINSLRLTNHTGRVVILDVGLRPSQRARLGAHATVIPVPKKEKLHPTQYKAFVHRLRLSGIIALIDSDMIITDSLVDIFKLAEHGRIGVFPDPRADRWFAEWEPLFDLRAPPRRQTYVNAGFVCFAVDHWPTLLERFWRACQRVDPREAFGRPDSPFWAGDQDALNAILMSEVPGEALALQAAGLEAYPDQLGLADTKVIDAPSLRCLLHDRSPLLLHYSLAPKAWERRAWLRVRADAYVRLLRRLLVAQDVSISLSREEVPVWLRPGARGWLALRSLDVMHGSGAWVRRRLPRGLDSRVGRIKDEWVSRTNEL
ncbi:MAG: hypothetical protein ACRDKZ_00910 [Actinomycetota bacterium]